MECELPPVSGAKELEKPMDFRPGIVWFAHSCLRFYAQQGRRGGCPNMLTVISAKGSLIVSG